MPRPKRAVLWDLDGTFISKGKDVLSRLWASTAKRLYHARQFWVLERGDVIFGNTSPPVPGIAQVLKALKERGVIHGIVTDRTAFSVVRYFHAHREIALEDFSVIHTRKGPFDRKVKLPVAHFTHEGAKNSATLFPVLRFLCEHYEINPERVVLVGDMPVDYRTANAGGVGFFASTWGWTREEKFLSLGVPRFRILRLPQDLIRFFDD